MNGPLQSSRRPRPSREAGFTLLELMVSLLLLAELLVAALVLFDFNNRVARVQTHVSDMQQNLRVGMDDVVRMARMGGRGGLPGAHTDPAPATPADWNYLPTGIAAGVRNDVADDATILVGDPDSPAVAEGTDVLTVRGVFTTPLLLVNYQDAAAFSIDRINGTGQVIVRGTTTTGVQQDLNPLAQAIARGLPEALLLVSAVADEQYAVVELVPGASSTDAPTDPTMVTIAFTFPGSGGGGGTHGADYIRLGPGQAMPEALTSAVSVGILEEYRYFVREEWSAEFGDPDLQPRLARQRVYPRTETAWDDEEAIDVADNIVDLQVALGVDTDNDDEVAEAAPDGAPEDFAADEWLLNHDADDPADARWLADTNELFYLRINVLARTDRRDPGYVSPPITRVETRAYDEDVVPDTEANRRERLFRRRLMSTVVDLRNL